MEGLLQYTRAPPRPHSPLICLNLMSLLLLTIIAVGVFIALGDAGTLLKEAHSTLRELDTLLPEARKALTILQDLCDNPRYKLQC